LQTAVAQLESCTKVLFAGHDELDDRETEAGAAAAARLVGAAEAVEGARQECGRQARSLVRDVQLDEIAPAERRELDRPCAVAERVLGGRAKGRFELAPRPGTAQRDLQLGLQ
jgi:hypothetical protein